MTHNAKIILTNRIIYTKRCCLSKLRLASWLVGIFVSCLAAAVSWLVVAVCRLVAVVSAVSCLAAAASWLVDVFVSCVAAAVSWLVVAVCRLVAVVSAVSFLVAAAVSCAGFVIGGGALVVTTLGGDMLGGAMFVVSGDSSCEFSSGVLSACSCRHSHG